jgi:4'-phosphopantetheinyl transferase
MQTSNLHISFSNIKEVELVSSKEFLLNANDLIIYAIYLPDFIELKSELTPFLNSIERNRAERFHNEIDRNRFIIYRSILKLVLAAYTKLDVKDIHFDYHFNKKPYIASHPELCFNISHSEDFAVIAISKDEVGIDIEYISENFDFTNLLSDIFTDDEVVAIQNADDKKQAFYSLWTRKEAFVKALGKGIDDDFKNIPCLDGQHSIDTVQLNTTKKWQLYSFDLANHYLGAVAFENKSTISKNLELYAIPNTMKSLLEMTQNNQ